jgi:hypothetical protein
MTSIDVKRMEMEAFGRAQEYGDGSNEWNYFQGKGAAFSEIWEKLRFGGKAPTPDAYNLAAISDEEAVRDGKP